MRILGLFAAVTQGLQEAIDLPCPEDWCVLGFVFPKHFDPVIFSGERIEEHLCYEVINTFNFEHSVYKEALSLCLMVWFVPLELKLTVRELLLQSDLCRSVQNQRQCRSCSAGVWLCGMGAAGKVWNPPGAACVPWGFSDVLQHAWAAGGPAEPRAVPPEPNRSLWGSMGQLSGPRTAVGGPQVPQAVGAGRKQRELWGCAGAGDGGALRGCPTWFWSCSMVW